MQCLIPSQNVRILVRGLHSLSRIGDDLYVEPTDEYLSFRTVNSAQSAYSSLLFYVSFFTKYKSEFNTEEGGKCKLSMKACLTVFKTPHCMDRNVDSCMIEIDKDCIKLIFHIRFVQGYTKNYFLSVNDNENVQLKYNKEEMCNKMSIPSKTLYGAIKHFRVNDEEITFSATIDKARLKNYFENIEVNSQKLVRTNFSLQPSEFEMYEIKQPGSITFALRELRAVCTFSELSNSSPVGIYFETAGRPVIFSVRNNSMYEADYVVSTLPAEMMCTDRPRRRSQLSDVMSTVPSTNSGNVNKKRKLVPITEETELNSPAAILNEEYESKHENVNLACVPHVSLVDIIKYNDEQKSFHSNSKNNENHEKKLSTPVQSPRNLPEFFTDDSNECLQMFYDQIDEHARSQTEKINKVFKYCYSYSPESVILPENEEILCNASDIGFE